MADEQVVTDSSATDSPTSMGQAISQARAKLTDSPSSDRTSAAPPDRPSRSPAGSSAQDFSGSEKSASIASGGGATTRPGDDDDSDVKDPTLWADLEKRRTVLENRGKKAVARYQRELETRFGFSLDDANVAANVAQFVRDPVGYFRTHRQHFEQIDGGRPAAAPAAAARPASPPEFTRPLARLQAQDGSAAYDAAATDQLFDHLNQEIARLRMAVDPMQQTHQQITEERVLAQASRWAEDRYRELASWDGFEELREDMGHLMRTRGWTDEAAYNYLLRTKYLPQQREQLRRQILDELRTRPAAPRGPAPDAAARSSTDGRRRGLTVHEAVTRAREQLGV